MRISDWSSDVCSSDLQAARGSPLALSQLLSQSCHMRASGALAGLGAPRSRACRTHHQRGNPEMKFRQTLTASVALLPVALLSTPAFAQSTGTVDFDDEIVVTGSASRDIGGVTIPETAKAKQVLGEEIIRRQRPGQTVNDIINLVPGVSFQNNDPWGSNGGGFTIRGFGADRVSQTLDGLPLNDSGN